MLGVHGGQAAPEFAAVFDVVVHQEGVVEQFDRDCRSERACDLAAEGAAGADAQSGAQALAAAHRVRRHQIIEMAARLTLADDPQHLIEGQLAVTLEQSFDERIIGRSGRHFVSQARRPAAELFYRHQNHRAQLV